MSERFGGKEFAIHAKGMELAAVIHCIQTAELLKQEYTGTAFSNGCPLDGQNARDGFLKQHLHTHGPFRPPDLFRYKCFDLLRATWTDHKIAFGLLHLCNGIF